MIRRRPFIVIADEDPENRLLLRDALAECRKEIKAAFVASGKELLDHLKGLAESDLPGLIMMDIYMSSQDGFQTLQAIKADPRLRRTPVLVLSGSFAGMDAEKCYELGANTAIAKPSSFGELVEVIRSVCTYWFDITEG